jgi:hypothetical protein
MFVQAPDIALTTLIQNIGKSITITTNVLTPPIAHATIVHKKPYAIKVRRLCTCPPHANEATARKASGIPRIRPTSSSPRAHKKYHHPFKSRRSCTQLRGPTRGGTPAGAHKYRRSPALGRDTPFMQSMGRQNRVYPRAHTKLSHAMRGQAPSSHPISRKGGAFGSAQRLAFYGASELFQSHGRSRPTIMMLSRSNHAWGDCCYCPSGDAVGDVTRHGAQTLTQGCVLLFQDSDPFLRLLLGIQPLLRGG